MESPRVQIGTGVVLVEIRYAAHNQSLVFVWYIVNYSASSYGKSVPECLEYSKHLWPWLAFIVKRKADHSVLTLLSEITSEHNNVRQAGNEITAHCFDLVAA